MMNEKEFEILFKSQFKPLCNLAFTIVKNGETSKDIVQQVFIKLWNKQGGLNIRGSVEAYLYRMVVNTALNHIEKEKKYVQLENQTQLTKEISEDEDLNADYVEENAKKVRAAVAELPEKCQLVFSLSRFENLSNKEIANYLDISVKTVEKHITVAFKALHKKLKPLINQELDVIILLITSIFSLWQVGIFIFALS